MTRWQRFRRWLRDTWWAARDWWKARRLLVNEDLKLDAQEAVNWVVYETNLPPDCVTGGVMRGGCSIKVKHNDAWEVFIHNTYKEAAYEAIAWVTLQGGELETNKATKLNRSTRRAFDSHRKRQHHPQHPQKKAKLRGRR